ncbi:helix-turn-helix domain-containing protein (plasmid) [Methylobacterium tardum]|nr:helix-turn-helix domain-containing protein [Methylobacterium tardum]URD40308.1 helix-turn-helix domain-containing protein [Methylobacterium tardum]
MALLIERLEALDTPSDAVEPLGAVDRLPEPEQPQPRAPAHTGREIQTPAAVDQPKHPGSKQERAREAVRALLSTGVSNREIARRVGVSPSTVAAVQKAVAESAQVEQLG